MQLPTIYVRQSTCLMCFACFPSVIYFMRMIDSRADHEEGLHGVYDLKKIFKENPDQ